MILIVAVSVLAALAGAFLILDFLYWNFSGNKVEATIEAFENSKPVLSFVTEDGRNIKMRADRVTHMGYLIGRPAVGNVFNAVYIGEETIKVRLHGYMHLVSGILLVLPMIISLAREFSKSWMFSQVSFLGVFVLIMLGGWAALKLIRGNY